MHDNNCPETAKSITVQTNTQVKAANFLSRIAPTIDKYREAGDKEKADTFWFAQCTDSPAATRFFKSSGNYTSFKLTVCTFVANIYQRLIDTDIVPSVVTPQRLAQVRTSARTLHDDLPLDVPLPKAAQGDGFKLALMALSDWQLPGTVLTNHNGNTARRWVTREIAAAFAFAFNNKVPVEFVHDLVTICWPETPPRTTSRELDAETLTVIKAEAEAHRIHREQEDLARQTADYALQRAASKQAKLTAAQIVLVETLQAQLDRVKQGSSPFRNDTALLRSLITMLDSIVEKDLGSEIKNAIRLFAKDYDIET
jgi:hypothetical protein